MILCGIDYSLTSPSVCVHEGDEWNPENCKFYFFKKKAEWGKQFRGRDYPDWTVDMQRYQNLTSWVMGIVQDHKVDKAFIEDYAFGATGRVFHIAENTGLMKYGLYVSKIPYDTYAPGAIKKFATGKGNAKKAQMMESFVAETGIKIFDILKVKEGSETPASDIVDAYFICKMGFDNEKNNHSERTAEVG